MTIEPSIRVERYDGNPTRVPCSLFIEAIQERIHTDFTAYDVNSLGIWFWELVLDGKAPRSGSWPTARILKRLAHYDYLSVVGRTLEGYKIYHIGKGGLSDG